MARSQLRSRSGHDRRGQRHVHPGHCHRLDQAAAEREWEIALVDINPEILEATEKMVRRYMCSTDQPAKIYRHHRSPRRPAGATIVICTIGVGSRRAWEQDVFVPSNSGSSAGGRLGDAGRRVAGDAHDPADGRDIASDCDRMCPDARFINYANPMTADRARHPQEPTSQVTGLCHGTEARSGISPGWPECPTRPSPPGGWE